MEFAWLPQSCWSPEPSQDTSASTQHLSRCDEYCVDGKVYAEYLVEAVFIPPTRRIAPLREIARRIQVVVAPAKIPAFYVYPSDAVVVRRGPEPGFVIPLTSCWD